MYTFRKLFDVFPIPELVSRVVEVGQLGVQQQDNKQEGHNRNYKNKYVFVFEFELVFVVYREAEKQRSKEAEKQRGREAEKQINRKTDKQINR